MEIIHQVHPLKDVLAHFEKSFEKRKQDKSIQVLNSYVDTNKQVVIFEILAEPMPDNQPG
jgi:hypothetical protein